MRRQVLPRGIGKIEVSAVSLFSEIRAGETVNTTLTVKNTGTRRLDTIRLYAEGPLGWRTEIVPDEIPSLDLRREANVELRIAPAAGVAVGDYEVRIKTESFAYNRRVPSEDKIYRLSIKPRSNPLGTGALILALFLLVAGAVAFTIKLTRR